MLRNMILRLFLIQIRQKNRLMPLAKYLKCCGGIKILKSEMEIKYEEYLKSNDKTKMINGKEYYKIVDCHIGEGFGIIIVPFEAVPKSKVWLIDENGFKFFTDGLVHIRFSEGIPEWYLKLATLSIDVVKPCEIGKYLRICEEDDHQ